MESVIPRSGVHFVNSAGKVTYVVTFLQYPEVGFFLDSG